ncbi:TFIIIC subunit, partial [Teratosphaeria destructans]
MAGPPHPPGHDDDGQWEYEHDENETDDVYFTLDLTSHVSDALINPAKKRRQRPSKKPAHERPSVPAETANGDQASRVGQPTTTAAGTTGEAVDDPSDESAGQLQLIGLHTENPFVRFNDRHYSCHWATDLGTQFHISKAGATKAPIRKGYVVDVVGTTRVKLYGKPVTIKERENCDAAHDARASASAPSPVATEAGAGSSSDVMVVRSGQVLKVPAERITDAKSRTQASFLERLSAIKVKKGETDFVPVAPVKHYVTPTNKAEIRQRALDARAAQSAAAEQQP